MSGPGFRPTVTSCKPTTARQGRGGYWIVARTTLGQQISFWSSAPVEVGSFVSVKVKL